MSLFVHFIISVLDIGKFFGHMLLSEVKQQGGCGVVTECVLEIGNQIIPADNGFLLGGKVLDDAHFVLARKVVIRAFIFNSHLIEMLFAE